MDRTPGAHAWAVTELTNLMASERRIGSALQRTQERLPRVFWSIAFVICEIRIADNGESIGLDEIYDGYKFASASKEAMLLSTIEVAEEPHRCSRRRVTVGCYLSSLDCHRSNG